MKEIIDKTTERAIAFYGDTAVREFYRRLKEHQLCSTRCRACGELAFPPRSFCPYCLSARIEWVELPRKGRLYAFTQQERSLRFYKPDVIGVVELEGVGRFLTRIDAKYEELELGMEVELSFIEISDKITLHQFHPVKSANAEKM